jgi:tripartite-type tricarboxylate transporter receptor subunit TctC
VVMVVHPSVPAKTVPEFIGYAKSNIRRLNMASNGNGSVLHLAGEMLKMMAQIELTHVPYRGAAPALTDLISGQVQVMFATVTSAIEYIKAGQIRPLAVTTTIRSEALPNIPSLHEFLPGYDVTVWIGVVAPRNTPAEIIEKLNKEINAALAEPNLKARFAELGSNTVGGSPADYRKLLSEETEKWAKVVKLSGAKPD